MLPPQPLGVGQRASVVGASCHLFIKPDFTPWQHEKLFWAWAVLSLVSVLLLPSFLARCVTWGKSLPFSGPQFPYPVKQGWCKWTEVRADSAELEGCFFLHLRGCEAACVETIGLGLHPFSGDRASKDHLPGALFCHQPHLLAERSLSPISLRQARH